MSDDKCPNCGGELISRVSFVDYCLDCETTIDASYWQTRAYVAEEHAKRSDAEVARLTAELAAANEDAERLDKLVMDAICRQTSEIDTNAGLDAHRTHIARVGGAS